MRPRAERFERPPYRASSFLRRQRRAALLCALYSSTTATPLPLPAFRQTPAPPLPRCTAAEELSAGIPAARLRLVLFSAVVPSAEATLHAVPNRCGAAPFCSCVHRTDLLWRLLRYRTTRSRSRRWRANVHSCITSSLFCAHCWCPKPSLRLAPVFQKCPCQSMLIRAHLGASHPLESGRSGRRGPRR